MYTRRDRRLEQQRKLARRRLDDLFDRGDVLSAAGSTSDAAEARQLVFIRRSKDGAAHIRVESYLPNQWDHTLDTTEHSCPDLQSALEWVEATYGLQWVAFRSVSEIFRPT